MGKQQRAMQIDLSLSLEVQEEEEEEEEEEQSGGEDKVLAVSQEEDVSQDKSLQENLNPEELCSLQMEMNRMKEENKVLRKVVEQTMKDYYELQMKFSVFQQNDPKKDPQILGQLVAQITTMLLVAHLFPLEE
ncbi:probable WRKY transcription factor 9 [Macadamia integrifolia]|uniref:probable WRKY transcription factor 9 n=1 Tax=Macadamia integrifolia TaxID=60698 RepID=UPI001C4F01EB|nr:probable WRKY transcription factor 9 [Macadamia integrifolia]